MIKILFILFCLFLLIEGLRTTLKLIALVLKVAILALSCYLFLGLLAQKTFPFIPELENPITAPETAIGKVEEQDSGTLIRNLYSTSTTTKINIPKSAYLNAALNEFSR